MRSAGPQIVECRRALGASAAALRKLRLCGMETGARVLIRSLYCLLNCTPMRVLYAFSLSLSILSSAHAASFADVAVDVDKRLKAAQTELAEQRSVLAEERLPLSQSIFALENTVIEKRKRLDELRKLKDKQQFDLLKLEKEVTYLEKQDEFMASMLNDFVRDFAGRLDLSETALYQDVVNEGKLAATNTNLIDTEKRVRQFAVIEAALKRLNDKIGGHAFAGQALGADGVLTEGRFLAVGPSVFFASEDARVYGLAQNQLNAADPVVVDLPPGAGNPIVATAQSGAGLLPLDASMGKALKIVASRKTLSQYVEEGGVVGYVIIGLGVLSLMLTLFKILEIGRFKVAQPRDVDFMIEHLIMNKAKSAIERASKFSQQTAAMFMTGIQHFGEKRGMLEELMFEHILSTRPKLERFLPFLAITAAAAPLLGLLGTVVGMIKTFQLITVFGTGDAKSLSSGISEALVTTALGLIVAIPILILHGMLSRMAKRKLGLLEQSAVAFVNGSAQQKQSKLR